MTPRTCIECLTSTAEPGPDLCPTCRRALELRDAYDRGWRGGWSAALAVHRLVRQIDDEAISR